MYNIDVINATIEALNKNNFEAMFVEKKEDLKNVLDKYIKENDVVSFGGSMTLEETGTMDYLRQLNNEDKIKLLDRNVEGADVQKIYRDSFSADVYFSSSNAVTENGYLYNVDGNGNRVTAMAFGPSSVIVIVGYNKIVATKEEAVVRVEKITAPKNAVRLNRKTPCVKTGYCMHCSCNDKICRIFTFLGQQMIKNRIKVIILGEEYGY